MVDLSDVIGKAIGGEEGKLLDELIDTLRRYWNIGMGIGIHEPYNDIDVIYSALQAMAESIIEGLQRSYVTKADSFTIESYLRALKKKLVEEMK